MNDKSGYVRCGIAGATILALGALLAVAFIRSGAAVLVGACAMLLGFAMVSAAYIGLIAAGELSLEDLLSLEEKDPDPSAEAAADEEDDAA